jgi:hypothetical protein
MTEVMTVVATGMIAGLADGEVVDEVEAGGEDTTTTVETIGNVIVAVDMTTTMVDAAAAGDGVVDTEAGMAEIDMIAEAAAAVVVVDMGFHLARLDL